MTEWVCASCRGNWGTHLSYRDDSPHAYHPVLEAFAVRRWGADA